jgi:hypothetical protein
MVQPTEEFRIKHPKEYADLMARLGNQGSVVDFGTRNVAVVDPKLKTPAQIDEAIKEGKATPVNQEKP